MKQLNSNITSFLKTSSLLGIAIHDPVEKVLEHIGQPIHKEKLDFSGADLLVYDFFEITVFEGVVHSIVIHFYKEKHVTIQCGEFIMYSKQLTTMEVVMRCL